jgi:hypothetical protein
VLAENNFGDTRSGGLAGPLGLFIILLMAVATVLLIRNMSSRIRRLPAEFPPAPDKLGRTEPGPDGSRTDGSRTDPAAGGSEGTPPIGRPTGRGDGGQAAESQ